MIYNKEVRSQPISTMQHQRRFLLHMCSLIGDCEDGNMDKPMISQGDILMKPFIIFFMLLLGLISQQMMNAQEQRKPIIVSPLIGDTLNSDEREHYRLFPWIEGFQWAVFYFNADSTLDARVSVLKKGVQHDTVMNRCISLGSLQKDLQSLEKLTMDGQEGGGAEVAVVLADHHKIEGTLLSVRDTTIVISLKSEPHIRKGTLPGEDTVALNSSHIQKIIIRGHSHLLVAQGVGLVVGGVAGAIIGGAQPTGVGGFSGVEQGANVAQGLWLGAVIGLAGGTIVGLATSSPDEEFLIQENEHRLALKARARYPWREPESLTKIK